MLDDAIIFGLMGGRPRPRGTTAPCYTFLERSRRADVCNVATYRFRDICGQIAEIGDRRTKMVHPSPFLDPVFGDT